MTLSKVLPAVHKLGWINNWMYSQRNPNSATRVIDDKDYEIIKVFFR